MPTILSLSSQVARGHVGHSANLFVWQRLGIQAVTLPTILLSNRPDYPYRAGEQLRPKLLDDMLGALEANGWLSEVDAIFTGYLPSAEHVALVERWVGKLKARKPELFYCCDPILGDEPGGLYVPAAAAEALRTELVPLADLITPNRFELGWLSRRRIESRQDAIEAARSLGGMVLATSAPGPSEMALTNLLVQNGKACEAVVSYREEVPHGTGDLLAALFLAYLLQTHEPKQALARATGGLEAVITASEGDDELRLVVSQDAWSAAPAWPVRMVEGAGRS